MALLQPLWNQNLNYPAALDRQLVSVTATEGVIDEGSLVVSQRSAGANMSIDVAPGSVVIQGTQSAAQERYLAKSTAVENLAIATAPVSGSRIDLVVAKVLDSALSGVVDAFQLEVVTGTAGANPVAPSAPASSVVLAQVFVATSVSSIVNSAITDVRPRSKPYLLADGVTMDGGPITMDGQNIVLTGGGRAIDQSDPTQADQLSRKGYVDQQRDTRVSKSGDTMSGDLNMGNNQISSLPNPTATTHAARKSYVDSMVHGAVSSQTWNSTSNTAMGSGTLTYGNVTITLPSGWGSMLVMFNGEHEWALKNYYRGRYIFWLETTGGSHINSSTDSILTPGGSGIWDYNTVPLMGTWTSSSSFSVRLRTMMSRLDGTAGPTPNVLSTRRRLSIIKFRTA